MLQFVGSQGVGHDYIRVVSEYKNSLKEIITIYFSYISLYLSLSFYLIYAQQSMVIVVLIA